MNTKRLLPLTITGLLAIPLTAAAQFGTVTPFAGTADTDLITALTAIVNALLAFAALVAAIFVVIGGVRYITSSGDDDAAATGKNTVIYAVIGLVIIALSAVVVNFIINAIP